MKNNLIVIGFGDHGKIIEEIVKTYHLFEFLGFLDDNLKKNCLGKIDDLIKIAKHTKNLKIFISIANNSTRERIFLKLRKQKFEFVNIIHPTSFIVKNVKIGNNVFIGANAIVNTGAALENGVFINTGCIIEHDNDIKNFCHLAPGVITGGGVIIGKKSFVGLGSRVCDYKELGDLTFVKMGSIVTKSFLKKGSIISGIPARIDRANKNIKNKYQ